MLYALYDMHYFMHEFSLQRIAILILRLIISVNGRKGGFFRKHCPLLVDSGYFYIIRFSAMTLVPIQVALEKVTTPINVREPLLVFKKYGNDVISIILEDKKLLLPHCNDYIDVTIYRN